MGLAEYREFKLVLSPFTFLPSLFICKTARLRATFFSLDYYSIAVVVRQLKLLLRLGKKKLDG